MDHAVEWSAWLSVFVWLRRSEFDVPVPTEFLTKHLRSRTMNLLNSTPTVPNLSKAPTSVTAVRKGFSDARRRALQTQGVVTMERVRANQATMKSVP